MTAVECNHANKIPEGMKIDSFGGYSCVKFHYIGRHHYREISQETAHDMYVAIGRYCNTEDPSSDVHLEKIDIDEFDGEYCLFEFYMPLKKYFSMQNDKKSSFIVMQLRYTENVDYSKM